VLADLRTLNTFTHQSRRFQIDYPVNWQLFERPDGVIFLEPGHRAGYSLFFADTGEVYGAEALDQYLVTFVAQNFAKPDSAFKAISQSRLADGAAVAQFSAQDPILGQAINEIRVSQVETIVFVALISASQAQWPVSEASLQALVDTFTPLQTKPAAAGPATAEAPVWELVGPAGNTFAFFAPSNWERLFRDESAVEVGQPDNELHFRAESSAWTDLNPAPAAAEAAALAYLAELTARYEALEHSPPGDFPLGTVTGKTVDFLYQVDDKQMAGSIIAAAHKENLYLVVFTAPAELYEAALQWYNPMVQSFTFLEPDEYLDQEQGD
jgi:hypothetical protein